MPAAPRDQLKMNSDRCILVAKKACIRCRTQKRRCDRAMPDCGLCIRLRQVCKYELSRLSVGGSSPSLSPKPENLLSSVPVTPSHLKAAIVQKLSPLTLEDTMSAYCREIESWFPIVSISRVQSQPLLTWEEAPLDVLILCLSVALLTTTPPCSPEDTNNPSEFKLLYLYAKSSLTSAESLGINSLLVVQSRILVTLFEVSHGFYPAAYISIGATLRAVEALEVHPGSDDSFPDPFDDEANREEKARTWVGILILDRYIAIESGSHPSLSRYRFELLDDILKPNIYPNRSQEQNSRRPKLRLARLFEASSLLDKIHTTLNSPTTEHAFNMEEILLAAQTIGNLETSMIQEIGNGTHLYSGELNLCNIALLLVFENGSKLPLTTDGKNCNFLATTSLISVLSSITSKVEPFTTGMQCIDFNFLPPFVTFLVYKAAAIVTERLLMDSDSNEKMRKLKILRDFLQAVGERWMGCRRYLKVLNEDTTPRTLKALEQT